MNIETTLNPVADRITDSSGVAIFSDGPSGQAHVAAHRALDSADCAAGYRTLRRWLSEHPGRGSRWVHLQWHMVVFELMADEWWLAYRRFLRAIHPHCGPHGVAPVDGPSALWRLKLAKPTHPLPWERVRNGALHGLGRRTDPYVVIHDLLALAGAGERDVLRAWTWTREARSDATLHGFATACLAIVDEDWSTAARAMESALPHIPALGGSRAQNELFTAVHQMCVRRAAETAPAEAEWTVDLMG